MPAYGQLSESRLVTCHPKLILIFREAIKIYDHSILCGWRGEELQNRYFAEGKSKKKWPEGAHNARPSLAIDVVPYPIIQNGVSAWSDKGRVRFFFLAGIVFKIAADKNIKIRWGRDWDKDLNFFDQKFNDEPHFELIV